MEFQLSYFKSWKMMLWKCCTQYASKFEKLSSGQGLEKVSFHSNPKERQCQRILRLRTIALISHASKVSPKFSKPGFNNTWTMNFQMFKLVLEEAEVPEIECPTSIGSLKKQESSRKTSISALLTMPKPLTVWITINCRKFWKRGEYQTTWPASWEIYMQVKK